MENPHLKKFATFTLSDKTFPETSDPLELAAYLYKKLDPEETLAFQKWLMIYKSMEPTNQLPEYCSNEKAFLDVINTIVRLQNSDPEYKKKHNLGFR
jgi:hypothetical protein